MYYKLAISFLIGQTCSAASSFAESCSDERYCCYFYSEPNYEGDVRIVDVSQDDYEVHRYPRNRRPGVKSHKCGELTAGFWQSNESVEFGLMRMAFAGWDQNPNGQIRKAEQLMIMQLSDRMNDVTFYTNSDCSGQSIASMNQGTHLNFHTALIDE